ncbi:MAG: helix-turn-helix domain-containing protein [Phenylobacterium sp.]
MTTPGSSRPTSPRLDQVIEATRRLFVQYGYRRTGMEDIAREAGLAKATLYLHFEGKEEVFRAMLERCREVIAQRCDAAEAQAAPLARRLAALLEANFGTPLEWFGDTAHMAELRSIMREDDLARALKADEAFRERLRRLLKTAAAAGEIDLARAGLSLEEVADVLLQGAQGAKHRRKGAYGEAVAKLVRLTLTGLAVSAD